MMQFWGEEYGVLINIIFHMYIRSFIIIILLLGTSCSGKKDDGKDLVNVLTSVDYSLNVSDVLSDKIYSLDEVTEFESFDLESKHYGNVILDSFNQKKLKRVKRLKYSGGKTELPFFITPLIIGNVIYLLDVEGSLVAYNKDRKEIIWKINLGKINAYNSLKGGVNYYKGNLYVTFGSSKIFSIDSKNGNILWERKFDSLLRARPYIHNGKVYVMTLNNKLYCLSTMSGEIIWGDSFLDTLSSQFGNSGLNDRGFIMSYGNSIGDVVVFAAENGEVIWKENIGSTALGVEHFNFYDVDVMPVIFDKKLYAVSSNGKIAAFEYISGVKLWEKKLSSRKTPWVTKDLIFIVDINNNLIALSRDSGKIKWYSELDKEILPKKENKFFYGPVVINGKVFVSSNVGRLSAFDYNSGELLSHYKIPKYINHFPFIHSGKLFMVNNRSVLYEYR